MSKQYLMNVRSSQMTDTNKLFVKTLDVVDGCEVSYLGCFAIPKALERYTLDSLHENFKIENYNNESSKLGL